MATTDTTNCCIFVTVYTTQSCDISFCMFIEAKNPYLSPATKEGSDIVLSRVVALYICDFDCLSGAFDYEGVKLGPQFLVRKLMGIPEGAT